MQPAIIATNFIHVITVLFYFVIIMIITAIKKMQPAIIATNIIQMRNSAMMQGSIGQALSK